MSLQKKKIKLSIEKEHNITRKNALDSSNSNFGLTEDSNTCTLNCFPFGFK